jgi:cytochrome P450
MGQARSINELPVVVLPQNYYTNMGPTLAAVYEQHGPIFRGRAPDWGIDVVFLVGPEANRFVLTSDRLKFSHHIGWGRALGVIDMLGDGLLTMDGKEHDEHRRMMNPAFAIGYMDRYLPIMNRIIAERTADWLQRGEVDVYDEARKITFDVAAETLVGLRAGPDVDRFREIFAYMLNLGMVATSEAEYGQQLQQIRGELLPLMLRKIHERRQHPTDDVLGMLVQARDDHGNGLSDEQLIAHTNILLVAGHETSTSLSAWLMYLLAQHPQYLERVMDEQAALLNGDAAPTLDAIKKMRVLDNALSEAERLYPPVGNGPRGVVEDFEFNGYHIPAGSFVFYSIAGAHYLPSIWAEPTMFDPDRFAAPREEHKRQPYSLVGFGGGPRICIGINFAQVEIKAMVSHLLRRYRLDVVPGQQITQFYRGTGLPINGIRMRVAERVPAHAQQN